MPTFAELIRKYIERAGITDAELARSIGVRRQTIFRWKEGLVARPRHRDDVMNLAKRLRLTDEERDELLIVAGFAPESMPESYPAATPEPEPAAEPEMADAQAPDSTQSDGADDPAKNVLPASDEDKARAPVTIRLDEEDPKPDELKPAELKADAATRPAWLWFAPLAAIALLVIALGAWLASGEPTPPTPPTQPAPTALPEPTRGGRPNPTPAAEGETLLLTALFKNYTDDQYNVAGRIETALATEIDTAKLTDTRADILPREILDETQAKAFLEEFGAVLLIWGELDSGHVLVNLSMPDSEKAESSETQLQSPDDLPRVINENVPQETRILALLALGEHFLATEQADKAVTALEKALALKPPEPMQRNLYFQLGRAYSAVQPAQSEQAINSYTKVLALSPGTVNAYYNRGLAYYKLFVQDDDRANLDLAIRDYSNMIRRKPDYVNASLNRGIAYYSRRNEGDLDAALKDLNFVVEQQPDSYRGYYNRSLIGIARDNPALWEPDLQRAKELAEPESDDYVNTLVGLCWGYMLETQLEEATTNCQEALDTAPHRGDSHDSMGIVHALNGDSDAALEQFELYIAWLSTYPKAYYERQNGPLVEEWIEQLQAGEQPITDEVLESLRNG